MYTSRKNLTSMYLFICILVTFSLNSSSSEENNQLTIECTTNNVSNPAISLIIGDERYTETGSNIVRTSLSEWNLTSYNYICIANNSVGGASHIQPLDIQGELYCLMKSD